MNLENKKQIAIIIVAVALGLAAVALASYVIEQKVNEQTKILAKDYQKKSEVVLSELDAVRADLSRVNSQYQNLAAQQEQLKKGITTTASGQIQSVAVAPFSVKTPPGKRALTINIDSLSAVGGLINSGDFVDIIAQLNVPGTQPQEVISVLFQNIQVLAVGSNYAPLGSTQIYDVQQRAGSLYVTLALDPEEASLLTFARTKGKLQLTLRPPQDKGIKTLKVASWDALSDFVLEKQGTELAVPRSKASIESVDSGKRTTEEVKPVIQIFKSGRESNL